MSKQYKGWEIAKMINEGTLKAGGLLKTNYSSKIIKIVAHHLETQESSRELGSSFFADGSMTYEIIKQPVSFMEAVSKGLEGKRIKVDVTELNEKYSEGIYCILNNYWNNTYYSLTEIFKMLSKTQGKNNQRIINEGKWYVEE